MSDIQTGRQKDIAENQSGMQAGRQKQKQTDGQRDGWMEQVENTRGLLSFDLFYNLSCFDIGFFRKKNVFGIFF